MDAAVIDMFWVVTFSQELAQGMDIVEIFNSFDYNQVTDLRANGHQSIPVGPKIGVNQLAL